MKKSYYFPHDYHARHDPKLERLRLSMGCEGIGIFWCLVEMLYEQGGSLELKDIEIYAKALNTTSENIQKTLSDFDLFVKNKTHFYSSTLLKRLKHINIKREKASASADKRWNANAMRTHSERNAIKESKRKDSIEEPTTAVGGLVLKNSFLKNLKDTYSMLNVDSEILACITWHKNKNSQVRAWDRAIRNWLKISYEKLGVVGGKPEIKPTRRIL